MKQLLFALMLFLTLNVTANTIYSDTITNTEVSANDNENNWDPEVYYNTIYIKNSNGVKILKFTFYYDKDYPCWNNFKITNLCNSSGNFNFDIYLDGSIKYSGYAQLGAFGELYFDDAFKKCNSSFSTIYIQTY